MDESAVPLRAKSRTALFHRLGQPGVLHQVFRDCDPAREMALHLLVNPLKKRPAIGDIRLRISVVAAGIANE